MNIDDLRQQIDSFFDGSLSDIEERTLREYLATHEIPEELERERRIILSLVAGEAQFPDGLEARMSAYIDRLPDTKILPPSFFHRRKWIAGIAAAVLLTTSVGLYIHRQTTPRTLSEQEMLACIEAQRALILVSQKLNQGIGQWEQTQAEIARANETVNKHLKFQ